MRRALSLATLFGAVVLWGCGDSSSPSYTYVPGSANIPACAHAGKAIPLPKGFPTQFPFPNGTDIMSSGPLPQGVKGIGISGYVPSSGFSDTVLFFKNQVKQAGFKVLDFQADAPNDSEGSYLGFGHTGTWQLKSLPGCSAAMHFAASSEPPAAAKP
jgi:hypothetical protein